MLAASYTTSFSNNCLFEKCIASTWYKRNVGTVLIRKSQVDFRAAIAGVSLAGAADIYFNPKGTKWMGKDFKIRSTNWQGNGRTGGKFKFARRVSRIFKGIGGLYGVYNFNEIRLEHRRGEISDMQMYKEQVANGIVTFGGFYGAVFGVGWEMGRYVEGTNWYQQDVLGKTLPHECVLCPK